MGKENLREDEIREKAIARLGLASFSIDLSIIGLIFAFVLPGFMALPWRNYVSPDNLALADTSAPVLFFGIILFVYFQVSEYFGVNASLGRGISGLNLLDSSTRKKPPIKARRLRLKRQIKTLGLPTLNPNRVASYNRADECCIYSDWLGSTAEDAKASLAKGNRSRPPSSKPSVKAQAAPKGILSVIAGLNSGQTVDMSQTFGQKRYFEIGRGKDVDLSLEGDQSISNRHCHIQRYKGEYIIQDGIPNQKGSRFGTRLNGHKVPLNKYMRLKPKDKIHLGKSTILEFL